MIHIRRCHICNETSESETTKIDRCQACGKYLAPFVFCNEPSDTSELKDAAQASPSPLNPNSLLKSEYPPIYGISLYW